MIIMATVTYFLPKGSKPTPEQKARIQALKNRPIVFDEDCPELTDEELKEFKPVNPNLPRPKRPLNI